MRRLLKRYHCPTPFHAVRARLLGCIASPRLDIRPMQAVEDLWQGEMPEFESLDDANELIGALVQGLWNRLAGHQSSKHPFRLTTLQPPTDAEGIRRFAGTRVEELGAFVEGLFGDAEAMDLPQNAHEAMNHLADLRSFFAAFVQFADDHESADDIESTVRNMQQLSIIAGKEINRAVQSCKRARRDAMPAMRH